MNLSNLQFNYSNPLKKEEAMETSTRTKKIIINEYGTPVKMVKQDLPGIFAGVDSWISQGALDAVERQRVDAAWKRKEQKEKRESKKFPYG